MNLFGIFRRRRAIGDSGSSLLHYPRYEIPFPGAPEDLTVKKAEANLGYLLASREQRLEILFAYLEGFDVRARLGLDTSEPKIILDEIHAWAKREFPKLYDPAVAHRDVWVASRRDGPEIVFSMLMDLAIFLGEMVIARRSRYRWALDLDPDNIEMLSYRRPVVQVPKGGPLPAPIILDFEDIVVGQYFNMNSPYFRLENGFATSVVNAISGAFERPWFGEH